MQIATLIIVNTSPGCLSYRLMAAGRVVWSNRVYNNRPEGEAGARKRMAAWAAAHGYTVVEEGAPIEQHEQRSVG